VIHQEKEMRELTDEELSLVSGGSYHPFVPSPEPDLPPAKSPFSSPGQITPGLVSPEPLVPPKFSFF
jgi:bacteriocin-like protein